MDEFNEIVNGWKNYIFKTPETEELAKKRLRSCLMCRHYMNASKRCRLCGCPVAAAVRSIPKKCPVGKW